MSFLNSDDCMTIGVIFLQFKKYFIYFNKVVLVQLESFLESNTTFEKFQSGFRKHHSTESALFKVLNDILLFVDSGDSVMLLLLDLSADCDTADHKILISRLEQYVGIIGCALDWFKSYLDDRTFYVCLDGFSLSSCALKFGVPQGSILAPVLFSLYICLLWGPFLPSMGCYFISMLVTPKLICP